MRVAVFAVAFLLPFAAVEAAGAKPAAPSSSNSSQLDRLFSSLARAQSADDAESIETQIEALFLQSGSPTVDLLMTRGQSALQSGDTDAARKVFQAVTKVAPGFAEGWHLMAQLQALAGDDAGAMVSLQKTLTLNPREFNALSHLGDMLEEYGDKKGALATYRKAQALDPQNEDLNRAVRKLSREVEGEKI